MTKCSVCGSSEFTENAVLWDALIHEWQLSIAEVNYINKQQGKYCNSCGTNLRSIALADALLAHCKSTLLLKDWVKSSSAAELRILEINEAGMLTPQIKSLSKHILATYPAVDIHNLPYENGSFDVVLHSDTLEHVANPVHALSECRRVLKPGGALCFTVPIIVGRMSRSREGLPKSYHGQASTDTDDFSVRTEFGADAWIYVMEAGFSALTMHAVEFPAAIAIRAVA